MNFNLIQTKFCFQNSLGQVYLTSTTRNQRVCEKYTTSQIARENISRLGESSNGKANQPFDYANEPPIDKVCTGHEATIATSHLILKHE